jgi:hypothetical protein
MGLPSTPEGEQAKKSMETRQSQAKTAMQELVEKICDETKVYFAGGTIIQSGTLKENIQEALNSIADRQFSEFKGKADFLNWVTTNLVAQAFFMTSQKGLMNTLQPDNEDDIDALNFTLTKEKKNSKRSPWCYPKCIPGKPVNPLPGF